MKTRNEKFAQRLHILMESRGVRQQELADVLSVSRQMITPYCHGTAEPNLESLVKIACFFRVSTDYLLGLSCDETSIQCKKTNMHVEFDVTYGDGTYHHAPEGVLFEAKGDQMIMHLGTSRIEVLFAVAECLTTAIEEAGLREAFVRYIEQAFDDAEEVNPDA